MTKESARAKIADLIARYDALPPARRKALSEMDTRRIFILPLFDALGWDTTSNPNEVAEEVSGVAGRADYAFRIGGVIRFLLEAKAVREDLDKPHHAVQAVSYAYNRGVPWAVLSDFEGLEVYYTEWEVDEVARCQVMNLHYDEYLEEFDLLWRLSKPAFRENALRKYTERRYGAVGRRTPVGDHLLAQFVNWREELFKYFWMYNHDRGHTLPQIDEAIQRLLDRLIFIRTCEDRRIEEPRLLPLLRRREGGALSKDLWSLLLDLFREFDATYDSRLFEPHLVDSLACEETPFRTILQGLYFSTGPVRYQFDVIPADVLGRVYEQYLGFVAQTAREVARQEAAQAALPGFEPATDQTVELVSKKLKRKMHGIYYTPQFVVDYIVEQTLGQVLAERSLDEVRELAVLDMACGSGSFLIAAYERLLRHHAEALQQPALSQEERLEILTRNVYGVDLDGQAVEVAQLNLLLKALETPRDLPNLNSNVKRGNSLVEGGAQELEPYFGEHWRAVAHPLNWKHAFPQPMKRGGFDVIVGNPPYQFGEFLNPLEKDYYKDHFSLAVTQYDTYWLFYEQCLRKLRDGGYHGYIVPDALLARDESEVLRAALLDTGRILKIAHVGAVFKDPAVSGVVVILQKLSSPDDGHVVDVDRVVEGKHSVTINRLEQAVFKSQRRRIFAIELNLQLDALFKRIREHYQRLGKFVNVSRGEETGKKHLRRLEGDAPAGWSPILAGKDVNRFRVASSPYLVRSLEKSLTLYAAPKIVIVKTGARLVCGLETRGLPTLQSLYNLRLRSDCALNLKYLLGLLNSRLLNVYIHSQITAYKKIFPQINMTHIRDLPIRRVDLDDPAQAAQHDAIVARVEELLRLYARRAELPETEERAAVQVAIEAEETALDALVYELYRLTGKEITLVEEQQGGMPSHPTMP